MKTFSRSNKYTYYRTFTLRRVAIAFLKMRLLIALTLLVTAQGTIKFGFEEYPSGTTPPFVKGIMGNFTPQVAASTTPAIPVFEGQKFLYASGRISIDSPNGWPIQSFTLHAYTVAGSPVTFYIGGQTVQQFGSWQTVQGSFTQPVQSFIIFAADIEDNPYTFAIDDVEFTTVPEPQTFCRCYPRSRSHPPSPFQISKKPIRMIFRALRSFASVVCLLNCSSAVWAQGTIVGFEEFSVGTTPPFVTAIPPRSAPTVKDSLSSSFLPYEGQKFLVGTGSYLIQSPDGAMIQSLNMHVFLPNVGPDATYVLIDNGLQPMHGAPDWQTIQLTLASPVQTLRLGAFYGFETLPTTFAIDDIEFTTVPEPQTFWLLTIGVGAILLRRSKSLKSQSG